MIKQAEENNKAVQTPGQVHSDCSEELEGRSARASEIRYFIAEGLRSSSPLACLIMRALSLECADWGQVAVSCSQASSFLMHSVLILSLH